MSPSKAQRVLRGFAQHPKENERLVECFKSVSPMGRLGTSDEIARAVVFLATSDSSYVTGIELS